MLETFFKLKENGSPILGIGDKVLRQVMRRECVVGGSSPDVKLLLTERAIDEGLGIVDSVLRET